MNAMQTTRKILALAGIAGTLALAMANAQASTWDQNHPRRAEVNGRLANQNARINNKVANGQMSAGQAQQLHHEDHQIRQEERDMASQNGGHITKQEQRTLNAQENNVSGQIHQQ
jgi:hypothetical protein